LTTTDFDGFQAFAGVGKDVKATCLVDNDGQRFAEQIMGYSEEQSGRGRASSSPAFRERVYRVWGHHALTRCSGSTEEPVKVPDRCARRVALHKIAHARCT